MSGAKRDWPTRQRPATVWRSGCDGFMKVATPVRFGASSCSCAGCHRRYWGLAASSFGCGDDARENLRSLEKCDQKLSLQNSPQTVGATFDLCVAVTVMGWCIVSHDLTNAKRERPDHEMTRTAINADRFVSTLPEVRLGPLADAKRPNRMSAFIPMADIPWRLLGVR